jgi:hypothetical protein
VFQIPRDQVFVFADPDAATGKRRCPGGHISSPGLPGPLFRMPDAGLLPAQAQHLAARVVGDRTPAQI